MQAIEKLIELNVLYIREMERRQEMKLKSYYEYWNILTNNTKDITLFAAVNNLKTQIYANSNIDYLKDEIESLQRTIINSEISQLRLCGNDLTKEELRLQNSALKTMLYMNDMVSIAEASAILNRTTVAIKQACQQERLLNTKLINNKTWFVHVGECEKYWKDKKIRVDCKSINANV